MAVGARKRRRMRMIAVGGGVLLLATILAAVAFEDAISYTDTPSQLLERVEAGQGDRRFRLGGLVLEGSIDQTGEDGLVRFSITDGVAVVPVEFDGVTPDLFVEGQGAVAEGRFVDGVFRAENILARHDEQYIPAEIAEDLRETGVWRGE